MPSPYYWSIPSVHRGSVGPQGEHGMMDGCILWSCHSNVCGCMYVIRMCVHSGVLQCQNLMPCAKYGSEVRICMVLKKLVRLGCITQGSFAEITNQRFSLKYQTFRQLAAAFISGSGLQSVHVLNVYRIPCTNCPRTYIGQTGRTLTQRLKEHQRAVRNADTATSALAEHAHSTGHPVNWTEARVIDTCPYTSRRCLLESWMIHKETNHLNRELGTLPHIYKTLIKHP